MRLLFFILICLLLSCTNTKEGTISPEQLSCEYMENPSVVDVIQPRLSWINKGKSDERGLYQSAYQIRVASAIDILEVPDLWDSGKVTGDKSILVNYKGVDLSSGQECFWQVRVWDQNNKPSQWSEPGFWRMGLLEPEDWKAKWIGAPWEGEEHFKRPDYPGQQFTEFGPPAPYLRKEFTVEKKVEKAVLYTTGLGYFEAYLNGQKTGDDVLIPNNTNYSKRPNLPNMYINVDDNFRDYKVMYLAYDVKGQIKQGKNAIGAVLGNGFYNPRMFWCEGYGTTRFIAQLHLTYNDGTEEVIASDDSWKASKSPIVKNMLYYGETYDARLEQAGWNTAEFDDTEWQTVAIREAPYGRMVAHTAPTDKVIEQLEPVDIRKLENGNYFVDFGKEISGWVRLNNVEGPKGHQVDFSFNGNLYSGDNAYIFKGEGSENYAPRFNWFVFSGVEISNWPGELLPEMIIAEAVNTDVPITAEFETSNELFNQINKIWQRSQLDNMHGGIASDCPHRERNGYTGDGQVACATVLHNFDARAFYQKWITDMHDAQNSETGYVPNGAPWQPGCGGGVAWGAAICIMPWEFYEHYGDMDMLENNYDAMKGYIRYMDQWITEEGIMHSLRKNGSGEVLKWFNLGEWVPPGDLVPNELVHSFYYWRCAQITSKVAKILGSSKESDYYKNKAEMMKDAFNKVFYDQETGSYGNDGANIFALKMGVPEEQYDKVLTAVKSNLLKNEGHLNTGIFGTRFFFEVLAENGLHEEAYKAMNKRTEPGFGRWIELGSTTTREHWDESGSYNHPMFGGALVWFYRNLAGMKVDENKPGYRHIIFKPEIAKKLSFVNYQNQTSYGKAGIFWEKTDDNLSIQITVPPSCTGAVYVPANNKEEVTEKGNFEAVEFVEMNDNYAVFKVESGEYQFITNL